VDIGPIAGIRPISMIRKPLASTDLSGVFAVELRKQANDDAPAHQRAARGLEDEEAADVLSGPENEDTPGGIAPDTQPHTKVSFFA
jgi:hypothetical protein